MSSNRIYPGRKLVIPGYSNNPPDNYNDGIYIVKRGDSLFEIAKKFGLSIDALKRHNRLNSNTIYPNMKLKIPQLGESIALNTNSDSHTTYRVKKGDSLWKIAQLFNVSVQEIMHWNDISNPSKLKNGEVLKIYLR
jgi:LysM repeat protein